MSKRIVLGDTHGRNLWKSIIEKEKPDQAIFIGDYFDSFEIDPATQINNFLDICAYKREYSNTILLIGNHDHHYFPEIGNCGTSGYQENAKYMIRHAIAASRDLLQMAYQIDDEKLGPILFTHAGVSSEWVEYTYGRWEEEYANLADLVNDMWKYKPDSFIFSGRDPTGNNKYQTPIWIRPASLMAANRNTFKNKVIQVVGHTRVKEIDIEGKATGGRYYFIDAIDVGQYLIIEDGEFKLGKIEKE